MSEALEAISRSRADVAEMLAFLDEQFPEDQQKPAKPKTCELCGWPFMRVVRDCTGDHRRR